MSSSALSCTEAWSIYDRGSAGALEPGILRKVVSCSTLRGCGLDERVHNNQKKLSATPDGLTGTLFGNLFWDAHHLTVVN